MPGTATTAPTLGCATGARLNAGKELPIILDHLAAAGCKQVRFGQRPGPGGAQNWADVETIVRAIEARNMEFIFQVSGWDNDMNDHAAEYATYAGECSTRYGSRAKALEMGNEPDHVIWSRVGTGLIGLIGPTPRGYTDLLKGAYTAAKKADPGCFVLSGGLGGMKADWAPKKTAADFAAEMYQCGVKGYFDALAFHPYSDPGTFEDSIKAMSRGAYLMHLTRQTMKANGDGDKQVWVTEVGWATGGTNTHIPEADQAARLVDCVAWMRARHWVGPICWFDHQDLGRDPTNRGDWMGLYRTDWTSKPIVAEYKKLAAAVA